MGIRFSRVFGAVINGGGSSCVTGNGDIKDENRDIGEFTSINVESSLDVTVVVGAAGPLIVRADSNILPLIETFCRNGDLTLRVKDNTMIQCNNPIEIRATTPSLDDITAEGISKVEVVAPSGMQAVETFRVKASGSSAVSVPGIDATRGTRLKVSGASRVTLTGKSATASITVSGSAKVNAIDLVCQDVMVDVSGAARAKVHAAKELVGELSGASKLTVAGNPSKIIEKSGVAKVEYQ